MAETHATCWRQVAGTELNPRSFRAATVPDGPAMDGWSGGEVERIEAKNRQLLVQHFARLAAEFAWVKLNPSGVGFHLGLGLTTRKNIELCLLARRGHPRIHAHDVRELIVAPRREHSRKPDEQYARIERLVDGPFVELFARQRRPGWISIGDEIDRFAQSTAAIEEVLS
jgi:N6-adenosine-specific RNA methylase IME4